MKPNAPVSPYEAIEGLVYFPRMLDKIRKHAAGVLTSDYFPQLGTGFDGRICRFLGINYEELKARVLEGGTDADILAWARARGRNPNADDIQQFSAFMTKRGWRDEVSDRLGEMITRYGLTPKPGLLTYFDVLDADEGRPPRFA